MVARLLWEQDAAGSSPVTSTTGSAGPQCRGLSLLTFLFDTRWHSFVMNTRTTRKQGEQRSPCFLVVEIGYKRVIFLQDLPAKAIAPTGFDSAMLHSR